MAETEEVVEIERGITWFHPVICAIATGVAAYLAMVAVIVAPVAPFPGVSGLYIAAAIYVPLSLWLGIWGVIAGYASCVILGYVVGYGPFSFLWALCDLFEGLIPLLAFRLAKVEPELKIQKPIATWALIGALVVDIFVGAISYILYWPEIFLATIALSAIIVLIMAVVNSETWKAWILYLIFGVFGASFGSALFGIGTLVIGGYAPAEAFWVGFIGWFIGDVLVLATVGTILMVTLTPFVMRTPFYVRRWFS